MNIRHLDMFEDHNIILIFAESYQVSITHPSAIAVFPTPGSPIRTGLFLVLLERIWMHLRISSSLPITGSSFPSLAIAVKSFPYFSSASYFPSGSASNARKSSYAPPKKHYARKTTIRPRNHVNLSTLASNFTLNRRALETHKTR